MPYGLRNPFYFLPKVSHTRYSDGTNYYANLPEWNDLTDLLKVSSEHAILLPVFSILSRVFTRTEFYLEDSKGNKVQSHKILDLIENPNSNQSKENFLAQHIRYKLIFGYMYIYKQAPAGFGVEQLINLNSSLIDFGYGFSPSILLSREEVGELKFIYKRKNEHVNLSMKEVLTFYDKPNGDEDNYLISTSRLVGLEKPLNNIIKSFEAKNIVLGTNGKELFSPESDGINGAMMSRRDQKMIEKRIQNSYGTAQGKTRAMFSQRGLKYTSLHIPLKELGLDESVINDAKIISDAYGIPQAVLNFTGSSAKFENQEAQKIDFIQDVVQKHINDFCNTINNDPDFKLGDLKLKGSLSHLPIMDGSRMKNARTLLTYVKAWSQAVTSGAMSTSEMRDLITDYEEL